MLSYEFLSPTQSEICLCMYCVVCKQVVSMKVFTIISDVTERCHERAVIQTLIQEKLKHVHNRTKYRLVVFPVYNQFLSDNGGFFCCHASPIPMYIAPRTHTQWISWLGLCVNRKIFFSVHLDGYNIAMASLNVSSSICKVKTSVYIQKCSVMISINEATYTTVNYPSLSTHHYHFTDKHYSIFMLYQSTRKITCNCEIAIQFRLHKTLQYVRQ